MLLDVCSPCHHSRLIHDPLTLSDRASVPNYGPARPHRRRRYYRFSPSPPGGRRGGGRGREPGCGWLDACWPVHGALSAAWQQSARPLSLSKRADSVASWPARHVVRAARTEEFLFLRPESRPPAEDRGCGSMSAGLWRRIPADCLVWRIFGGGREMTSPSEASEGFPTASVVF